MKKKIKEMFIEKSDRFAGYTHLVVVTEDGDEYISEGDYCGGIPVTSWHKLEIKKEEV